MEGSAVPVMDPRLEHLHGKDRKKLRRKLKQRAAKADPTPSSDWRDKSLEYLILNDPVGYKNKVEAFHTEMAKRTARRIEFLTWLEEVEQNTLEMTIADAKMNEWLARSPLMNCFRADW
jgi:hypothetical protein